MLLPAQLILLGNALGGDPHLVLMEGVRQSVLDHGVLHADVAHLNPGPDGDTV